VIFFFLTNKKERKNTAFFTLNQIKSRVVRSGICSSRDGVMLRAQGSSNITVCS